MSLFSKISDTLDSRNKKAKKIMPSTPLHGKVSAHNKFPLSSSAISGTLDLKNNNDVTISRIEYMIKEVQDPIIGKDENALEIIHSSTQKKRIKIKKDDETTHIPFSLDITFGATTSDIGAGDMSLMNKFSERSKLTAINFKLTIEIEYTLPNSKTPKEKHIYTKTHDIGFE